MKPASSLTEPTGLITCYIRAGQTTQQPITGTNNHPSLGAVLGDRSYSLNRYMSDLGGPPGYAPRSEAEAKRRMSGILGCIETQLLPRTG